MLDYRKQSNSPQEASLSASPDPSDTTRSGAASEDTRLRLLNAAGEVFAERGFKDATVRDICSRAGANVAAVNYHFGDKNRLYSALLKYADHIASERHPEFPEHVGSMAPEARLTVFVRQFVSRAFDPTAPAWHERLIAREMIEPTHAMHDLIRDRIKPRAVALQGLIRELLGSRATDVDVQLAACSIIGQILMYHKCRVMMKELMPAIPINDANTTPETVERIAQHITAFSLAAINDIAARINSPSSSKGLPT